MGSTEIPTNMLLNASLSTMGDDVTENVVIAKRNGTYPVPKHFGQPRKYMDN